MIGSDDVESALLDELGEGVLVEPLPIVLCPGLPRRGLLEEQGDLVLLPSRRAVAAVDGRRVRVEDAECASRMPIRVEDAACAQTSVPSCT